MTESQWEWTWFLHALRSFIIEASSLTLLAPMSLFKVSTYKIRERPLPLWPCVGSHSRTFWFLGQVLSQVRTWSCDLAQDLTMIWGTWSTWSLTWSALTQGRYRWRHNQVLTIKSSVLACPWQGTGAGGWHRKAAAVTPWNYNHFTSARHSALVCCDQGCHTHRAHHPMGRGNPSCLWAQSSQVHRPGCWVQRGRLIHYHLPCRSGLSGLCRYIDNEAALQRGHIWG